MGVVETGSPSSVARKHLVDVVARPAEVADWGNRHFVQFEVVGSTAHFVDELEILAPAGSSGKSKIGVVDGWGSLEMEAV